MTEEPLVSIVKGNPTDDELAALIAVLAARSSSTDEPPQLPSMSAWVRSARPSVRPASWRAAGLPGGHR